MNSLVITDWGLIDYAEALAAQQEACAARIADRVENTVLLCEHPAVITLGARKSENKLKTGEDELAQRGIRVVSIGRGGGTTAHNPGQLVIYPIVKLKSLGLGLPEYVRRLEEIGIQLLDKLHIDADRRKGYPGLWIGDRKIASLGVQVQKWVTFHGIAINIFNDLSIFEHIVPCGLDGVRMTSVLQETASTPTMRDVKLLATIVCKSLLAPEETAV